MTSIIGSPVSRSITLPLCPAPYFWGMASGSDPGVFS
jgi:hypothetical protein